MSDPFALEVHRPVQPEDAPPGLPVLPPYVSREHDEVLGQVVRAAADGRSGIAVLVGGSSTGKTRGLTNNGTASGVSRWRAKCLRLGEVNAVDYFAHPAHMIRVTASD